VIICPSISIKLKCATNIKIWLPCCS